LGKIPNHFLADLIARADIVELIDQRVPLKRAGSEYKACCPFHDEKTPSFTVSQQKQFYHCFGCGAHGTAIGFLMNYDNLGFREAVEELAGRVGMVIPEEAASAPANPEVPNLLELVEKAQQWFQQQLRQHALAPEVIQYLKARGLSGQIAAEFGIGFAPEQWDGILIHLGQRQQNQKLLAQAVLLIEKDEGGYYDRFRNRVMFPIEDYRGRIVGFGGRIIGDGEPKYLNSPETPLFHKGAELYNLHRARRAIGREGFSIVVEGYMDVIGLAQFEVENVVATLGTATTSTHLQRLFRAAPHIIFCFDGDRAGRDAAWRGLQVVLPELKDGRQVGILLLPEGEDPDSLVRKEGKADFEQRVKAALPLPDFLFNTLTSQLDMQRLDNRAKLSEQARPLIAKMPEGAFRELMLDRLNQLVGVNQTLPQTNNPGLRRIRPGGSASGSGQSPGFETLSIVAKAICLTIQSPQLVSQYPILAIDLQAAPKGTGLLVDLMSQIQADPGLTTAQILERMRETNFHSTLEKLAACNHMIAEDNKATVLGEFLHSIEQVTHKATINQLLMKSQNEPLSEVDMQQLKSLSLAQKNTGD